MKMMKRNRDYKMTSALRQILLAFVAFALHAPSGAIADSVDYIHEVRPILQKHCYSCHGAERDRGGLRLDIKSEAFKGGDSYGASIVPGDAEESPLIQFVADPDADMQMPPEQRLTASEIAILTRWVTEGATWPDGIDLAELEDKLDHWSFKPIAPIVPPKVIDDSWPRGEIDAFVLSALEQAKLLPSPEAEPVAWLRRVSMNLTGLPPSPEEVAAFLEEVHQSPEEDAPYEKVVERLLDSPRYGERWAQHWLDVVRYADTHGFEVNTERPNAWPYRDYVIQAFNRDTPYDQFVREQIAGDAYGMDAATGFLVTASVLLPGQIGADEPSKRLARQDAIDEMVVNIGQTFLGLSIGCARCHDHKFDPISQVDYFAMQSFVAGVEYGERELKTPEAETRRLDVQRLKGEVTSLRQRCNRVSPLANAGNERSPVNAQWNIDRFSPVKAKRLRFTILATNKLEPCIDEIEIYNVEGENIALATAGTTVTSSGDTVSANRHELRFLNDGLYGNSRSWMSNEVGKGWVELEFAEEQTIESVVWGRDREKVYKDRLAIDYRIEVAAENGESTERLAVANASDRIPYSSDAPNRLTADKKGGEGEDANELQQLLAEIQRIEGQVKSLESSQVAFAGVFRQPDVIRLLSRGDPEQPREEVAPAVLPAIGSVALPKDAPEQERRLALAKWIVEEKNPMTARVMVNRVWQGHFGTGIVETPSDFGRSGMKPSHPELLDWLASEFVRARWSVKHLQRLIVLSATYRQSTRHNPDAAAQDAEARLLWRYPPRRLTAEEIRDSMLAYSGRLNLKMGGPGFNLFKQRGGLSGFTPVESFSEDGLRRMIYAHKVRRERDTVFGAFDSPDGGQSAAQRRESTTPIQALNLFNSRFTLDESQALASRVQNDVGSDPALQAQRAWMIVLNREPTVEEQDEAKEMIQQHGLPTLCRVLFNCNEFLFLP